MSFRDAGRSEPGNAISRDSAYLSANGGLLIPACNADKSIVIYDVLSYGSGKLGTAADGGGTQICFVNSGSNHFSISAIVPAGQGVYTDAQSGNITITYAIVDGLPTGLITNIVSGGGGATTTTTTAAATTTTTTAAATTTTTTAAATTTTTTAAATTTTTTAAATTTTTTAAAASNFCMAEEAGNAMYWYLNTVFVPIVGANATHNGKTQYTNIATVGNASYELFVAYAAGTYQWQLNDAVNLSGSSYGSSDGNADDPWDAGWTNAYYVMTETSASNCAPAGTSSFCIDASGYPEDGTWVPYATYDGKPVWALLDTTGSGDSLFMWYSASGSMVGTEEAWNFTDYGWGLHEDSNSGSIGNNTWGYSDADCADPWDCAWVGAISGCSSYTVDTSTTVNFTKANWADSSLEANQDRITDTVWITRDDSQGIFNAYSDSSYDPSTPSDTEWAIGTIAGGYGINDSSFDDSQFDDWINVIGWPTGNGMPPDGVGVDMVVHLIAEDLLLDIKFTSWTTGDGSGNSGGGGFAYTRSVVTGISCVTEGDCP